MTTCRIRSLSVGVLREVWSVLTVTDRRMRAFVLRRPVTCCTKCDLRSAGLMLRVLLPMLVLLATGCQTLDVTALSDILEDEPEFVTPTKLIPVWSDTVLHQAGRKGQRGCGGRMMFYAGDGKRAVRVDGSLVVYVWDDSREDKQRKPDRKYVFTVDDFQKHYSKSTIGESYSFWIPWDETGGPQTELTLVVRFVGRDGAELTSSPARVILPGLVPEPARLQNDRLDRDRTADSQPAAGRSADGVQQAGYEEPAEQRDVTASPRKTSLTTAEIPLTDGFLERNMSNRAAPYSAESLFEAPVEMPREPEGSAFEQGADADDSINAGSDARDPADSSRSGQAAAGLSPGDRSLRFQHRVRTSRAAQRSVGRALSERYQSASRLAPWERD
jgi:hypothetical protein